MIGARNIVLVILAFVLVSSACAKKSTRPEPDYRDPLAFDLYKWHPELGELDSNYVRRVYEAWDNELKDDINVKSHTWLVGDYKVFVYYHGYIEGMLGTRHDEVLFFTTTKPTSGKDKVHSTITPFKTDFRDTSTAFSKIQTYVYVDKYWPIKGGEKTAIGLMTEYLDVFIQEYGRTELSWMTKGLQWDDFAWDWGDHYVYYKSPGDFGGAIIVNKLTSKLDFLGSSVWFGPGMRYFPPDESAR
jgi:hypothetical protein